MEIHQKIIFLHFLLTLVPIDQWKAFSPVCQHLRSIGSADWRNGTPPTGYIPTFSCRKPPATAAAAQAERYQRRQQHHHPSRENNRAKLSSLLLLLLLLCEFIPNHFKVFVPWKENLNNVVDYLLKRRQFSVVVELVVVLDCTQRHVSCARVCSING